MPDGENSGIKRHYPQQPVVGVGAVVFRGDEVLLVRRGQEPARGSWSLPGAPAAPQRLERLRRPPPPPVVAGSDV